MTRKGGDARERRQFDVTLLGTGTSVGIPIIGCLCETCTSDDPYDTRSRCSCLVEVDGLRLLIDTSADFRTQMLAHDVDYIDAVLFTHHHFDHIAGIDDLRPFLFRNRRPIPCFANRGTARSLRNKYSYIFSTSPHPSAPGLRLHDVDAPFVVGSRKSIDSTVEVLPIPVTHGDLEILGYRIGPFAYVTDASAISQEAFGLLAGVDTLVLNALRPEPHPTHFSIDEAIAASRRIGARTTYFVHMSHEVLHARDQAQLPTGFQFGYDGLQFAVETDTEPPPNPGARP